MGAEPVSPPTVPACRDRSPLVIGVGNELRRDDGCGLAVARRLRSVLRGRAEVVELVGEPTALLDLWEGRELVLIADAIRSGGAPGAVLRIEVGDGALPAPLARSSTHGLSLGEGVALGRSLGRLPDRLVVYGIEAEDVTMGVGLSPRVAAAVEEVAARIEREMPGAGMGPPVPSEADHA